MTLAELVVRLDADASGLERGFTAAQRAANALAERVTQLGKSLSIGLSVPIVLLGASTVQAAAQMDSLTRGLTAVTGSAAETKVQLARLEDVAKLPGLGFREAIQGSINLQAAGLSARTSERALKAFGNALATVGRGKADLDGVTLALTQMASKSKISAEEINQLNERVPQIRQAMLAAFGTADTQALGKAGITPAKFIEAILVQLEKLPQVTGGAQNAFENFSDALFRARAAIGEKLLPAIVPLIEGLATMLVRVRDIDPVTIRWAISIAAVAAAIGPLIFIVGQLTAACTALAGILGIAGLAGALAVGGPILIGLGLLAALFIQNKLVALEAEAAADRYAASLVNLNEKALLFNITQRQTGLFQLQEQQRQLRREGKAFENRVVVTGWTQGGIQIVRRETQAMREAGEQANIASREIADMSKAFAALQERGARTPPVVPIVAPAGPDKLRGLIDGLTDRLRELRELQKFSGAVTIAGLPDNAQAQVRLVNSLATELDALADGMKRFQDAGRTPPAGLALGIETLTKQLQEAQFEVDRLATKWNAAVASPKMLAAPLLRVQVVPTDARLSGPAQIRQNLPQSDPGSLFGSSGLTGIRSASDAVATSLMVLRGAIGDLSAAGLQQLNGAFANMIQMFAQLTPAGLAAAALSSALEAVRPAIEALLLPVKIFGEIIAISVVPILRLLFPVIKAVAIVFAFLQEMTDRVIGTLLKGVGWFVRAIGKIVNFLDPFGNPGNGLVKLGDSIRGTAQSFFDAADQIHAKRKELEALNFDDALAQTTNGLNRLTEAVLNTVDGFKVVRLRFNATDPTKGAALSSITARTQPNQASGARGDVSTTNITGPITFLFQRGPDDPPDIWEAWKKGLLREARNKPGLRALAAQVA